MKKILLALVLFFTPLTACSSNQNGQPVNSMATTQPSLGGSDTPLATLNGEAITEKDVMLKAKNRMMKLMSEMYSIKKQALDEIIDDRVLENEAKKQGTTPDKLLQGIAEKSAMPSDKEAKVIFEMQKNGMYKGKDFDAVKGEIKGRLGGQKKRFAINEYIDGLRKGANVKINLERPAVEVSVDDDPSQGDANAPITLIEFSEFQCPFCKRTRATISKILDTYKGKVRYVFRDFPLSFHQQAKPAAIAANCANKQNKYWEFNAKLFENQQKLSNDLYQSLAKDAGLDLDAFDKCLKDKAVANEIDKDQEDGISVGVSGTPAYFINGKFLSGAQPFEAFQEIIDEELAK